MTMFRSASVVQVAGLYAEDGEFAEDAAVPTGPQASRRTWARMERTVEGPGRLGRHRSACLRDAVAVLAQDGVAVDE
jgi:hypothetical protein